eukprot:Nk52_evm11s2578 gene=Nk52_evmTU11s2578
MTGFRLSGVLGELVLLGVLAYSLKELQVLTVPAEKMYWNVGYGIISVASFAGMLRFAGLGFMAGVHDFLSRVGETVGITGVILGACACLHVEAFSPQADLYAFAIACLVLTMVFQTGVNELVKILHVPAMAFLGYHAFLLLPSLKAQYILGSIGLLAICDPIQMPLANAVGVEPVDVFHILFSASIYCFTSAALLK